MKKLIIGLSIPMLICVLFPLVSWLLEPNNITGTWYGVGTQSDKILTLIIKNDGTYTGEGLLPGQWVIDDDKVKFIVTFGNAKFTLKDGNLVRSDNGFTYYRDKDTAEKMTNEQKAAQQKDAAKPATTMRHP